MSRNVGFKDFQLSAPKHKKDGHDCRVLLHNSCVEYEILISEHPDESLSSENVVMVQYICAAGRYTLAFSVATNDFPQVVASILHQLREQAVEDVTMEKRRLELERSLYVN